MIRGMQFIHIGSRGNMVKLREILVVAWCRGGDGGNGVVDGKGVAASEGIFVDGGVFTAAGLLRQSANNMKPLRAWAHARRQMG